MNLLENLPFGVLIADSLGVIQYSNAKLHELLGEHARVGSLVTRLPGALKMRAVAVRQEYEAQKLPLLKVLSGRASTAVDEVEIGATDKPRILKIWAGPILATNQVVQSVIGTFDDITEHVHAKMFSEQREEQLRNLINSTPDAIQFKDAEGRWVLANDALVELFGLCGKTYLGKTDPELGAELPTHKEALSACNRSDEMAWQARATSRVEEEVPLPDGSSKIYDVIKKPIFHSDGRRKALTVVARDITEGRRAEIERDRLLTLEREEKERSDFIAKTSKVLASTLDCEFALSEVVKHVVPRLGDWCAVFLLADERSPERVVSAHTDPALAELCLPDSQDPNSLLARVLRTGKSELIGSMFAVPLLARGKSLGAVLLAYGETSGRKHTPKDLSLAEEFSKRVEVAVDNARLYAEAQRSIRVREEFISVASHELRTPLTTIRMRLDMLERYGAKEASEIIPGIRPEIDRFMKLVETLLDSSRLSAGRLDLKPETLSLSELVGGVVKAIQSDIEAAKCVLRLELDPKIVGNWDRLRLHQVVTNLLANAVKFGAGKPVEVSTFVGDRVAVLKIRDHGIGISKQDQARIFDRFERGVSERHYGGLGLGLYISQQIIRSHGGAIRVESEVDRGATFIVELPLA